MFEISSILILFFFKNSKIIKLNLSKFSLLFINSVVYDLSFVMILRKIVLLAASIIKFVILFIFLSKSYANENTEKKFGNDKGIVSIMYHRFNENKYPSTNIEMKVFEEQIKIIKDSGFDFYDPKNFEKNFSQIKKDKKILLTIDDAFQSFYEYAWPYLKKEKIPFILFV